MRPNFTLSLSVDGIALLHRAAGGWRVVGEVPLTEDLLRDELAMLRRTAASLEPAGVRCKLLIPNDQIRYLTIDTPGLSTSERHDAAAKALAQATPYAIEDLAFDISPDGARTHVAAVARETLDEAETFASQHRFHPVSFVAAPADNPFLGEPFFGPSQQAEALLEPGETVEADGVAVVVIGAVDSSKTTVATDEGTAIDPQGEDGPLPEAHDVDTDADHADEPALSDHRPIEARISAPDLPSFEPPVPGFSSRRKPTASSDDTQEAATGFAEEPAPPIEPPVRRRYNVGRQTVRAQEPEDMLPPAPEPTTITTGPSLTDLTPEEDAKRLAIFGTRDASEVSRKPRYLGLILTAALLVVLTVIAVWASVFLDNGVAGLFRRETPQVASDVNLDTEEPQAQTSFIDPSLSDEDAAVLDALRVPQQPETEVEELTPEALVARYAVTGIFPLAPEVPTPPPLVSLDDLYVTSIDPINLAFDAVALPDVTKQDTDLALDEVRSPMAADVRFDLNEDGLVEPTPDGALNPDGVRVFAGRPSRVPPQNLRRTEEPDAEPANTFPELAAVRPRVRPSGLSESNERATLGGLTRNELADYRPRVRPESAQEAALASASLFPQQGGLAGSETGGRDGSMAQDIANAVAVSIRPDARPGNFSEIVDRAQQAPERETRTAAVAPQSVAPSIPSSTSVAREATVRNALNLRRLNLIGVYGKPSDRRALVRLPNGRYQKVQVGDRVDGGRVSAIGDNELRYQKSGRSLVLKMPDS